MLFHNVDIGVYKMLDYLGSDDPYLSHKARSWLIDSESFLERILDPIFQVFNKFSSFKTKIIFLKKHIKRKLNNDSLNGFIPNTIQYLTKLTDL